MAIKTFTLDTNAQDGVPGSVTAPFGKIVVTGFSDDQPDPDLGAGKVYTNVAPATPTSSAFGTAELRLQGALATEISFQYGSRGNQHDGEIGGFTAYGFTETGLVKRPSGPGMVFKQFAVNLGQPIGPAKITGLPLDPLVNPSGSKYFCGLRWTSSTKANDVLTNTRANKAQIKNIIISFEAVEDIYKNPASFPPPTINGPTLTVVFDAKGAAGVVSLDDLARAIDPQFTHFNWVQTMTLQSNNTTLERIKLKADLSQQTGTFVDPHIDPHTDSTERIVYVKDKGTQQEEGYLVGVEGAEASNPGGQLPDSKIFYFNEGGASPEWKSNTTNTSLLFSDSPSMPKNFFKAGDTFVFRTELHAVSADGSKSKALGVGFTWQSDARRELKVVNGQQQIVDAGGGVNNFKFFGLN